MTVDEVKQLKPGDEIHRVNNISIKSKVIFCDYDGILVREPHDRMERSVYVSYNDVVGLSGWRRYVPWEPFSATILDYCKQEVSLVQKGGFFHLSMDDGGIVLPMGRRGRYLALKDLLAIRDMISDALNHPPKP